MLHQYQTFCEDLRSDCYSKYQCQDRKSSASSTSSSGSGQSHLLPKFTDVSRQVLANALQKNWNDNFSNQNGYDDSLTNLNWLHNVNPIKINEQLSFLPSIGYPKERATPQIIYQPRTSHPSTNQCHQPSVLTNTCRPPVSPEIPTQVQPDYKNNPNLKPPFSYAILISWAMKELGKPKITLSDIYNWIIENFSYYRHADSSWQNSIRHNLSLGKCFEKVPRRKDEPGKGGFWRINPQHSQSFDVNLSKIKYSSSHCQSTNSKFESSFLGQRIQSQNNVTNHTASNPMKRSRKSPITVTHEDWDSQEPFSETKKDVEQNPQNYYTTFDDLSFVDNPANFNSNSYFNLSPFDNSSSDSNNYGPISDTDIPMNHFDDHCLEQILGSPMLMDKEQLIDHDDFHNISSNNDFSDLFYTSKDDLQDLNSLLGIF